jgi:hypothetical protein
MFFTSIKHEVYIDIDDLLPDLPAPGADPRKVFPYPAPQAKQPSSLKIARACAVAAAWIPCGLLIQIFFFSIAETMQDLASAVAAWTLFVTIVDSLAKIIEDFRTLASIVSGSTV